MHPGKKKAKPEEPAIDGRAAAIRRAVQKPQQNDERDRQDKDKIQGRHGGRREGAGAKGDDDAADAPNRSDAVRQFGHHLGQLRRGASLPLRRFSIDECACAEYAADRRRSLQTLPRPDGE